MFSSKKALCRCFRRLAVCSLKLVAEPDFAMASGSDEERWARLGSGTAGADGQAELPEPLEGAAGEEAPSSPWWMAQAAEWRRQGWSDEEIWSYLLGRDDNQHSEEWWDSWSSGGSSSWSKPSGRMVAPRWRT